MYACIPAKVLIRASVAFPKSRHGFIPILLNGSFKGSFQPVDLPSSPLRFVPVLSKFSFFSFDSFLSPPRVLSCLTQWFFLAKGSIQEFSPVLPKSSFKSSLPAQGLFPTKGSSQEFFPALYADSFQFFPSGSLVSPQVLFPAKGSLSWQW